MTKPNTQNFTPANAADINIPHRTMQFASAPVGLGLCLLGLVISFCVLVAPEAFASMLPMM